ncbi:MAG: nucleotidyltransferase domain-containing protein [Nanoarchaeota archaeon]|nr:nucleotidyltransferase domain-containing protein [Nanoarchaeota archaeon]
MDVVTILDDAKDSIRPDPKSLVGVDVFVKKIRDLIKKNKIDAVCMKGGSIAKGTFLKKGFDVDLFVQFDPKYEKEDLSAMLGKMLAPLNPSELHGSRNYFQVKNKFVFEIIPVLKVKDYKHAKNVTDMSPLHVEYVRKHLKLKPFLADEIRLAKQFCKSIGVYGAESYISGLSGHVLDILVIHHGSFLNLLTAIANGWGSKKVIDPELHLDDPEKELDKSKRVSPLILVDPLQPDRNAAAALSAEKYERLKRKAREFLKEPSIDYFKIQEYNAAFFKKKLKEAEENAIMMIVYAEPLEKKIDVSGAKMLKVFEYIKKEITGCDFTLYSSGWQFKQTQGILYFIVKNETLAEFREHAGPPVRSKKFYKQFITKHPEETLFIKDKKVYALVKRKNRTIRPLIKKLLASVYVNERTKKIIKIEFLRK